jgi:endonuclease/exonuclease/phosphatase family metal-dependent hydrolase
LKRANPNFIIRLFQKTKSGIILGLNVLFLLSILSNIVPPSKTPLLAPFGFIIVPMVVIHIALFLLNFRSKKVVSLVYLGLLIFSSKFVPSTFNLRTSSEDRGIRVMTWNVKNFDLYNWTKNKYTRAKLIEKIDSVDADIICFQEFYTNDFEFNNIKSIKNLGYAYYAFYPAYTQPSGNRWGLAIFSKYPIKKQKTIALHKSKNKMNVGAFAEIDVKGRIYRVFNAHFQSIHFDYQDYNYLSDVERKPGMFNYLQSRALLRKILPSYVQRESQVLKLLDRIGDNTQTILCCDLNDIPNSYAYRLLLSNLKDAFLERGSGFSNTINIVSSLFRIDYIFASKDVKILNYKRLKTALSDHNMVVVEFE